MIKRDSKTGRIIGKPKIQMGCKQCSKQFECYESDKRSFCSKICSVINMLKYKESMLGLSVNERVAVYRKNNRNKTHDVCPDCGQEKLSSAVRCVRCAGLVNRGENNYRFKGGYENHLWHNKQRYWEKLGLEGNHTQEQWQDLKLKYNYMCLCCKLYEPEITLTEDHIIPISKGGNNDISNIQPLCRSCNSRKYNHIINYIELSEQIMTGEIL